MPYYPKLIRQKGTPKVYEYTDKGYNWITDPESFAQKGYQWGNIADIDPAYFAQLTGSSPTPNKYPWLMQQKGKPEVYEYTPEGYQWVKNPQEFAQKGYGWGDIQQMESPEFLSTKYGPQYENIYKPYIAETNTYYDQMLKNLQGEFGKRGILSSGAYGQAATGTEGKRASALAKLALQRQLDIGQKVGTELGWNQQMQQNQWDLYAKLRELGLQ